MKLLSAGRLQQLRPHLTDVLWALLFVHLFKISYVSGDSQFQHPAIFIGVTAAMTASLMFPISLSTKSELVAFNIFFAPAVVGWYYLPGWEMTVAMLFANLLLIPSLNGRFHLLYQNIVMSSLLILFSYLAIGSQPISGYGLDAVLRCAAAMAIIFVTNSTFWPISMYFHDKKGASEFANLVPVFGLFSALELSIGFVAVVLLAHSLLALGAFVILLICVTYICNTQTSASTERAWLNLLFELSHKEIDASDPLEELKQIVADAQALLKNEQIELVDEIQEGVGFNAYLGVILDRPRWLQCTTRGTIKKVQEVNRDFISTLAISIQNTFAKAAEHSILEEAAYRDSLTGLPNRRMVLDMVERRIRDAVTAKREGALLFMDLNGFKQVNDTYGHETGDIILQQVAFRLSECFRGDDAVGRLAGDEFVVVIESLNDGHSVSDIVERIERALEPPVELANATLRLSASIGVAVFPRDGDNLRDLLHAADTAMYNAKKAGQGWALFS